MAKLTLKHSAVGLVMVTVMILTVPGSVFGQTSTRTDLELALLADMSGSVDQTGFDLQRNGYIDAFQDPNLANAIQNSGQFGSIAVTMVYWDSSPEQIVGWTLIDGSTGNTASDFAQAIQSDNSTFSDFGGGTDMTEVLNAIADPNSSGSIVAFSENNFDGIRNVIDLSTDGNPDDEQSAEQAATDAKNGDVDTINAIAIGSGPDVQYLEDSIIGGQDAFVQTAEDFDDFADSILEKLLREITGGQGLIDPSVYEPLPELTVENARLLNSAVTGYLSTRRKDRPLAAMTGPVNTEGAPMLASTARTVSPSLLSTMIEDDESVAMPSAAASEEGAGEQHLFSDGGYGVYARPVGVFQDQDETGGQVGFEANAGGLVLGLDKEIMDDLLVGLSTAFLSTQTDVSDNRGEHEVETLRTGPYVSYSPGPWFIDGSLTYGYQKFTTRRFTGGADAESEHDSNDVSAFGRTGFEFDVAGTGLTLTPEGSFQYLNLEEEEFKETGPGALEIDQRDTNSLRGRLGTSLAYPTDLPSATLIPELFLGWENEFLADNDVLRARTSGGGEFQSFDVSHGDEDSVMSSVGLTLLHSEHVSAFAQYHVRYYEDGQTNGASVGFRFQF